MPTPIEPAPVALSEKLWLALMSMVSAWDAVRGLSHKP